MPTLGFPSIAMAHDAFTIHREPKNVAALKLLFSHDPPEIRTSMIEDFARALSAGDNVLEGLHVAKTGERIVGTLLVRRTPGASALVWPARTLPPLQTNVIAELHAQTAQWASKQGIELLQAMIATDDHDDRTQLLANGYAHVADISYLSCSCSRFPQQPPETKLDFTPVFPEKMSRLAKVVEATYQESLDCPQLDGMRSIDDVLDGYRQTGVFAPHRWLLVEHAGDDIGCLLLTDHPQDDNWELIYMGILPPARGNGFGLDITRYAQWHCGQSSRSSLVLAVDTGNQPALRMYEAAGFLAIGERSVLLRSLKQ